MERPGKSQYNCPECDGEKETDCPACGAMEACSHCNGTGWDPGKVDIPAFRAAGKALLERMSHAQSRIDPETGTTWERVAVTDYLLDQ